MEKEFNEQEALMVIRGMIAQAKTGLKGQSYMFLLWGWLVFLAALSQYGLMKWGNADYEGYPWLVMLVIGIPGSIYYGIRGRKHGQPGTYINTFMKYLWTAFGVSLFIVLFFTGKMQLFTYPMLMVLYGIGTFVTGGALNFRPLVLGGIACWVLAFVAFYVPFDVQLLLLALSILLSYIIPGHISQAKA
jgi:hypothetical protein